MKSKLLVLLVVGMMIASLTACGTPANPASSAAATTAAPEATPSAEAPTTAVEPSTAPAAEVTTYSFLMDWNGGAAAFPDGWDKGVVAQAITAKTGVALKVETITSSEREKLATVFASGDLPDMTNGPHWSTDPGGEGELIKNAGVQGLLLPLKSYLDSGKYPNINRLYEVGVISQKYLDKDVNHKDYNGEIYVIPTQTGRGKEDVRDWAYNLFARKDILEKLGITPESVTTQDAVYDLLKKIKEGSFTDINGKPVIPGGTWHNGWDYGQFLKGFNNGGVTGWAKQADGTLVNDVFTQAYVDRALYMRKLVAEGLMDAECFTQTDTQGKEKMVTGRVAVFGCHYPNQYGFFQSTLMTTNPEMTFVPLGPILDMQGGVPSQVERIGRTGTPVVFFSKQIKTPEKALAFIDYLNSDEGLILSKFGIEGQTYTMDNGVPKYTEEADKTRKGDSTAWNLMGFGVGGQFIGADPSFSKGWDADYNEAGYVKAREINPLKFIEYKTVDDVVDSWTGKPTYDEKMSTLNIGDELKKAFLTKTDDECKAVIENIRNKMKAAGYEDMAAYVNEQAKADPKILN